MKNTLCITDFSYLCSMQTSVTHSSKRSNKPILPLLIRVPVPKYRAGQVVIVGDCGVLPHSENLGRILIAGDSRYFVQLIDYDGYVLADEADISSPVETKCDDRSKVDIVFFGDGEIAEITLCHLHQLGYNIVAVVTNADRPGRRKQAPKPTPVKVCAETLGLKVLYHGDVVANPQILPFADIGVIVEFKKLPASVYHSPRFGSVNLHLSLLPSLKGATPVSAAIRQGLEYTGVTIFDVNDDIDSGGIYANYAVRINPDDTATRLTSRLAAAGAALMDDTLLRIATGRAPMTPQRDFVCDYLIPSYTPKHTTANRCIDWKQPAEEVLRFIRSLSTRPGAHTRSLSSDSPAYIRVLSAELVAKKKTIFWPGTMMSGDDGGLYCVCGGGDVIRLNKIQLPGGRPMTGKDYVNGCQGTVFCVCD